MEFSAKHLPAFISVFQFSQTYRFFFHVKISFDMGVSKLSAKDFFKVNYSLKGHGVFDSKYTEV